MDFKAGTRRSNKYSRIFHYLVTCHVKVVNMSYDPKKWIKKATYRCITNDIQCRFFVISNKKIQHSWKKKVRIHLYSFVLYHSRTQANNDY